MKRTMNRIAARVRRCLMLGACAVGGIAFSAVAAEPRYGDRYGKDYRFGDEQRFDRHDPSDRATHRENSEIRVDINIGASRSLDRRETGYRPRYTERRVRYWVEPEYRAVSERVWIEPVYQTVIERVWVPPVHQTVYEEIYVPARYEIREVIRFERHRRIVCRERTLVEPAHTDRIARRVCTGEGRWEQLEKRVCVSEGRWDVNERQVCLHEGRWDYRVERVEPFGREEHTSLDVRF